MHKGTDLTELCWCQNPISKYIQGSRHYVDNIITQSCDEWTDTHTHSLKLYANLYIHAVTLQPSVVLRLLLCVCTKRWQITKIMWH